MEQGRPLNYQNDLKPPQITEQELKQTLSELEPALQRGIEAAIKKNGAHILEDPGSIFNGRLGTAYALLRLNYQLNDPFSTEQETDTATINLFEEARAIIRPSADLSTREINPGRPSPLTSSSRAVGALVLRVLCGRWQEQDPRNLLSVLEIAISQEPTFLYRDHRMGVDDVLAGRSGLLWAVLEIWKRCPDQETQSAFAPVFQSVHRLVKAIVDAGTAGAKAYRNRTAKEEAVDMPLMWPWVDDFYGLGAMHGIAGVLATLLDPALPRHSMRIVESYKDIAQTISALCKLSVQQNGHLAMSIPDRPTERASPFVQICHGAPGLLVLLAAAQRNPKFASQYWNPEWDRAINSASDVVWRDGLLSKGCSLCHGLAGNAFSLLLLVDPFDDSKDGHLSAALAMLLEVRSTPPFATGDTRYRTPDHPWSLFEGLAGVLCAWSEACVLIRLKLMIMELKSQGMVDANFLTKDKKIMALQRQLLGFPCLVGGVDWQAQFSFCT